MKKVLSIIGVAIFLGTLFFGAAWAEDKEAAPAKAAAPSADDKEKAEIDRQVGLFYQLVGTAETEQNPLLMIGAIRLFDDLPYSGIAKPGMDEKKPDSVYDRMSLLNEAKKYAAGDTEMLALLVKMEDAPETTVVRGRPVKGSPSGPRTSTGPGTSSGPGPRTSSGPGGSPGPRGPHGPGGYGNYYAHNGGNAGVYRGPGGPPPPVYYADPPGATCFIATAAYGSPFAERVDTLRRFRDLWLLRSGIGSAFVDFYYDHSPAIANAISTSPALRGVTRVFLYPITVVAGACLGQTADLVQVLLGAGLLVSLIMLYRRKGRPFARS